MNCGGRSPDHVGGSQQRMPIQSKKCMRILLVNQFFWPDCAATSQLLTDLARHLAQKGHQVTVICADTSYADADAGPAPNVTVLKARGLPFARGHLARLGSYLSFLLLALWKSVSLKRQDVVVTLTTPPLLSLLGTLWKKVRRAQHFTWEMDIYPDVAVALGVLDGQTQLVRLLHKIATYSRNQADGVLVPGECMRRHLASRGIDEWRISVVENWADNGLYSGLTPSATGPLRLLYSGNFGLAHDDQTLSNVLLQLRDNGEFEFEFAGGGARRDELERFCADHDVRNVRFYPYRNRTALGSALAAAHIGLVTQRDATLGALVPSKVYGLLAVGRPILFIGPRDATPAILIRRFHCGWQVDCGDSKTLLSLLQYLSKNRRAITAAGDRGRRAFVENYETRHGVSRIAHILEHQKGTGRPRRRGTPGRAATTACIAFTVLTLGVTTLPLSGENTGGAPKLTFDDRGLHTLTVGNHNYIDDGAFQVQDLHLRAADGHVVKANLAAKSSFDPDRQTLVNQYEWGKVAVHYSTDPGRVRLQVTTTNSSASTIQDLIYQPLVIRLPSKPKEYDGSIPLVGVNMGEPTLISLSSPASTVMLSDQEIGKPLLVGFPWALDKPSNTRFPVLVVTGRDPMLPNSLPPVQRPIGPGSSDTYQLALYFGGPGANPIDLAHDFYAKVASEFPRELNWPDRRPIGSLIIGTADTHWPQNPRGWFLDASLNAGNASEFRKRLLRWADNSIAILRRMNAQGMVTWDIEGEQFPHPSTYVGDPRLVDSLAPEMAGVVDDYFGRFRRAGLRVGLTLRPQQFVLSSDRSSATQQEVADPAELLIEKISYAKKRWDATLFYIDSNGDPAFPMNADILKRVAKRFPDVLLMPEHENLIYYASTAPYRELRGGRTSTSPLVRSVYPKAFSIINTADASVSEQRAALVNAVREGDILMFRGWFDDPGNAAVASIYQQAK
ncbi:MAG: hypothetical protein JWP08_3406 [Bryobacterales bacterium]|nr:hypothetical protein [Bryobacterales bacterium]